MAYDYGMSDITQLNENEPDPLDDPNIANGFGAFNIVGLEQNKPDRTPACTRENLIDQLLTGWENIKRSFSVMALKNEFANTHYATEIMFNGLRKLALHYSYIDPIKCLSANEDIRERALEDFKSLLDFLETPAYKIHTINTDRVELRCTENERSLIIPSHFFMKGEQQFLFGLKIISTQDKPEMDEVAFIINSVHKDNPGTIHFLTVSIIKSGRIQRAVLATKGTRNGDTDAIEPMPSLEERLSAINHVLHYTISSIQ